MVCNILQQITPLRQRTLNNGLEDSSWEATAVSGYQIWIPSCTHRLGVYSLGAYSLGAYRSWGLQISGYQIWIPLCTYRLGAYSLGAYSLGAYIWEPTGSRATDFGSRQPLIGLGLQSGGLQSGGLQSGGLQSGGLQSREQPILGLDNQALVL